jgi:hypothetical protein
MFVRYHPRNLQTNSAATGPISTWDYSEDGNDAFLQNAGDKPEDMASQIIGPKPTFSQPHTSSNVTGKVEICSWLPRVSLLFPLPDKDWKDGRTDRGSLDYALSTAVDTWSLMLWDDSYR